MEHFRAGEAVVRREVSSDIRGKVVSVTENGRFVTVRWSSWLSVDGYKSTHRAEDLTRLTDWRGVPSR